MQNRDGGWGYAPGRDSWLEPTCYALLALHGDSLSVESAERAWSLIRSWQLPDGAWRPAAAVQDATWATALCLTLHSVRGVYDESWSRGTSWLLGTTGSEGGWLERILVSIWKPANDFDRRYKGWPWRPDCASWVEPTAHAMIALKRALRSGAPGSLAGRAAGRLRDAERMLLDRRTADGGWNYGNRRVLETDLPSYPETTAVALLGLDGSSGVDWNRALDGAFRMWEETESRLARAWLAILLRNHGRQVPETAEPLAATDPLLTALEAMAAPEGGHQWLKTT